MVKVLQVIPGCKGLSSVNIRYIYKVVYLFFIFEWPNLVHK